MPYISQKNRSQFDVIIDSLDVSKFGWKSLEILLTRMANNYGLAQGGNYAAYNKMVGMMVCATLELERRAGVSLKSSALEMFTASADTSSFTNANILCMIDQLPMEDMVAEDMNYCVTKLCHNILRRFEGQTRLFVVEDIILVMSKVLKNYYKDVIGPYEDTKIVANGPVSEIG